ncbi:uncharacterized protein LAESUDRAFT_671115 [Laetiporus sulphureus 93-53]|uniref:Vacuolar import and degradation protein 21 n=1 Tax=Laetiporus sulphureus 93-53 TaxID=1314785 RepID=A0A165H6E0_9APHY|nr:uncharacterized protein LAESUDRAFT_671115 [Laetiporus sulphureus 93-53]KZT11305.1 hypothetical protein LAESUDRAFT_671115 [Laetiporus sulphureus 93-53]
MSQPVDALVEDRISQLQEISQRRQQLLQEMYHLMQRRDDAGAALAFEQDDSEGLGMFLERFDLEKHPDTGHISDLSEAELLGSLNSQYGEGSTSDKASPPDATLESPMSEVPASPKSTHEDGTPEVEQLPAASTSDMDVEEMSTQDRSSPSRASTFKEELGSDDILILEAQPQRGIKRRRSMRYSSDDGDEDRDELDLLSSSPSRRSRFTTRTRSATQEESHLRLNVPYGTPSPPPESQELRSKVELVSPNSEMFEDGLTLDTSLEIPVSQDSSEQTVDHLLQPYSPPASVLPTVVADLHRRREYLMSVPSPLKAVEFNFETDTEPLEEPMAPTTPEKVLPPPDFVHFHPAYTLPPLSSLPPEFNRKSKSGRHSKKREKEKEKVEKGDNKKEEWVPMGINKWGAVVRANPVWKKLSKASKCLNSRDWNIGMTELRFIRTLDRVEMLKEGGWSFRQPKKHRANHMAKTHWDYLMDEMKWMRIDFREERRWKIALAFTLAHSVMDWHRAGSLEERVRRGICVLWKPPLPEEESEEIDQTSGPLEDVEIPDMDDDRGEDSRETTTPANEYASDDESDEETEKEQRDIFDALAPSIVIEDAFSTPQAPPAGDNDNLERIEPKLEDVEDLSALRNPSDLERSDTMDVDEKEGISQAGDNNLSELKAEEQGATDLSGLNDRSQNPMLVNLSAHVPDNHVHSPSKHKFKSTLYAPLREQLIYSDVGKLFVDSDDLDLAKGMSELTADDHLHHAHPPLPDLSSIFPDLVPFGLVDPASGSSIAEGKKKSDKKSEKDDPTKRVEDVACSKLVPLSEFMYVKPTLLSALQPSRHWQEDHWDNREDFPVFVELEGPSTRTVDENLLGLFDGTKSGSPSTHIQQLPTVSREIRKRVAEQVWTPYEDNMLKQLAERYPNNWRLIADAFKSSRVTIKTDERSPIDCYERWNVRWGGGRAPEEDHQPQVVATPTQMTTRGHKRSANANVALANATVPPPPILPPVPKKQRRHTLMFEAIRKAMKKKEAAYKANVAQRKPSIVHDTHSSVNSLPKMTPAELSRKKAEKEAAANQEALVRKREADLARQTQYIREQAQRQQGQLLQQPHPQQPQPQQAQQTQQQLQQIQSALARPVGTNLAQAQIPQIRSQVGISQQQQRLSNPMALANTRISPTQMMQAQAQAQARALAHAQAQAASSALSASAMNGNHLSPPYAARAASSSPGLPHQSPPLSSGTPVNAANSPRPQSTQPHMGVAGVAQNVAGIPRQAGMGFYHIPQLHGTQFATEQTAEQVMQLQNLVRLQQAQRNVANHGQNPVNGSYSQS